MTDDQEKCALDESIRFEVAAGNVQVLCCCWHDVMWLSKNTGETQHPECAAANRD